MGSFFSLVLFYWPKEREGFAAQSVWKKKNQRRWSAAGFRFFRVCFGNKKKLQPGRGGWFGVDEREMENSPPFSSGAGEKKKNPQRDWDCGLPITARTRKNGSNLFHLQSWGWEEIRVFIVRRASIVGWKQGKEDHGWGAESLIFSRKRGIKWSWARGSGWFRVKKKSS